MDALESIWAGRTSDLRLQLRAGSRARGSASSRPSTGKSQQPKRSAGSKLEDVGIPRASSVPLLWDKNGSLEIHSTPVSLATRSLSNRSATSSTHSAALTRPSSTSSSSGAKRRQNSHRPTSVQGQSREGPRSTWSATGIRRGRGRGSLGGERKGKGRVRRGLKKGEEEEKEEEEEGGGRRVSGSLSPEVEQFLRDMNSAAQPSPSGGDGRGGTEARGERGGEGGPLPVKTSVSDTSHHRPKPKKATRWNMAAHFSNYGNVGERASSTASSDGRAIASGHTHSNEGQGSSRQSSATASVAPGSGGRQTEGAAPGNQEGVQVTYPIPHQEEEEVEKEREGVGGEVGEGGGEVVKEAAARRIQRWYRGQRSQQQVAEVQRLLRGKREELDRSRSEEEKRRQREEECRQKVEEVRRERREAKMREARQAAIRSLHQKREERKREGERIAQQEIAFLQASGKIKKPGDRRKKRRRREEGGGGEGERKEPHSAQPSPSLQSQPPGEGRGAGEKGGGGGTGKHQTVPDSVIDEFFEANSSRLAAKQKSPSHPHPSHPHPSHRHPSHPPSSPHKPPTTYSDILDTLKLLEEAPPPLPGSKSEDVNPSTSYLSSANLGHLNEVGGAAPPTNTSLSESKLQSILSYLDEMERADGELLTQLSRAKGERGTGQPLSRGGEPQPQGEGKVAGGKDVSLSPQLEAATAVASDVTATILAQRMELDNKNKTVEMLQKALSQQRELTVYHAKEMEKEGQRRLDLQREEYETTIKRHQCFIDQLIEDKKVLSERCEQLVKELKEMGTKYQTKIKTMEECHAAELSKVKQVAATADKLRREKWRVEESQRIKEATVRSLEPEIQRIIAKSKAEIQKLKALHEAELLQAEEKAGRRFVSQVEELRTQCAVEKEQACAHERELARQRYEKLAEQEELSSQQQRRRLFAELQQERDKMATQFHQQQKALDEEKAEMQEAHTQRLAEASKEHSRVLEEMERRHGSELRALEERLAAEKEAWQENITRRQETAVLTREREMREALRQERDKEIEMVIRRLEEETEAARVQNEKAAEARIKRIREKCEAELNEVERSERSTQEKLNTTKQQLGELEGELARVRSLLRQKEEEVRQVGEVASKLSRERDNMTDVVRQEFADRLVTTEEENRQLKIEMSELRARQRLEQERAQRDKERELEEVHSRVRQALAKKEENLASLRSQHEAALKRAEHLEMLLERQRRELLKK